MKRQNVCKHQGFLDTSFKQTERASFLCVIPIGIKNGTAFKYIFEETVPKLSVNFGYHNSQDPHKNQYYGHVLNFYFMEPQYSDKF